MLRVAGREEDEPTAEDDRAGVDALVDEVHRDAEDLDAVVERLLDRADAREGREERRVDVEDAVGEARHEGGVEDCHVAGEDDELDAADLAMRVRVNGEVWGEDTSAHMHHTFADMIAYASRAQTVYPGELFGSGTAAGDSCGKSCASSAIPGPSAPVS